LHQLKTSNPAGGTPTASAIRNAAASLAQLATKTAPKHLILLTDGGPNCNYFLNAMPACSCQWAKPSFCCTNNPLSCQSGHTCLDDNRVVQILSAIRQDAQISTSVLALAGSTEYSALLEAMAKAGNDSSMGASHYYPAAKKEEIEKALKTISRSLIPCTIQLDKAASKPEKLEIHFNGKKIARDISRQEGWDYLDSAAKNIKFYGTACEALQKNNRPMIALSCEGVDADDDGFTPSNGDCNDSSASIHPLAKEIMDGKDNNCDGIIDADFDGDGYRQDQGDCNDLDPLIHPGAVENCYDGRDNDCNGFIDEKEPDQDQDGYGPCGGDCHDANPKIYPQMKEIAKDGIDNNCDFLIDLDLDGDGWTAENGDCDDKDPKIYPGAALACNTAKDYNCNKIPDNTETNDMDGDGMTACEGDCDDFDPFRRLGFVEFRDDKLDNDCDGKVDNVVECDCKKGIEEAAAMDLCQTPLVVTRGGAVGSSAPLFQPSYGAIKPRHGCSFFAISTGRAWSTDVQDGTSFVKTGNPVTQTGCMVCTQPGGTLWEHPLPKGCCQDEKVNDPAWVRLEVMVPVNARGFKFDVIFLSAEYPEYVHSDYNDTFYAIVQTQYLPSVQNISFDAKGQPLTINNGWFENPLIPTQSLSGTGYDKGIGSSSGWLTTIAPCTPGEKLVLTFWIHDEGDSILDSSVIIDNWRWIPSNVGGPITIK
jgi:hypothetical protein